MATLAALDKEVKAASKEMNSFTGADLAKWEAVESRYTSAVKAWAACRAAMGPSPRELRAIARANRGWAD